VRLALGGGSKKPEQRVWLFKEKRKVTNVPVLFFFFFCFILVVIFVHLSKT
jgi:hypothetical protein